MSRLSAPHVSEHWYVACRSAELSRKPISRTVLGVPLVLFRDGSARATALVDRCAHRNAALSSGRCSQGRIVCRYHGWSYDADGVCQEVPALVGAQTGKARRVPVFSVREQQGLIWVYGRPDAAPRVDPYWFSYLDDARYRAIDYQTHFEATLSATLENILDVPHTAFLHRGWFRGVERNAITAVVRRKQDRVEAEYVGEPRPAGVIGHLLAPKGGVIQHFDRFILPSLAQVEYALGAHNHVLVTSALTPKDDFHTAVHARAVFRTRLPPGMVAAVLMPIAQKIARQDASVLAEQTRNVRTFGGEQFVSTDVDVLGPHILRMLKEAEREFPSTAPWIPPHDELIQLLA